MEENITEKKIKDKTERERQTFFRVTFKNNCNLLQIADNKANMIISINALVISSIIAITGYGTISNQLDIKGPLTLIPILLLLCTCLFSTILAVRAAKPKIIGKNQRTQEKGKSSMLFFGESSTYNLEEYLEEIDRILPSKKEIHQQMSIALFYQGKVLNRKYKLLGYAYNVFILGLVVGVITFLIYMLVFM
ncbi:DUF5706 domain-containing protein [Aquiflexum sp. TKW24L]|uniref:Pycsar system effector family protein n=1 Tax=Aquiflexum sp. TKW24L TaxID=2942212 RepID=UPI0020BF5EAF|nr:Pycsar system effector family protein [Aquiflexum sp. TKW24L]MCL6258607.1 DUF5706 domain-containing protein [Aquiflexum sp. TKW24L]